MRSDDGLLRGTLDLLILKVLSLEPMHGWGVTQRIEALSGETLTVPQGSLYASLHRLARHGWVSSEWRDTEHGRRARYYTISAAGRRQLDAELDSWARLSLGVQRIVAVGA